jgi:hypothetical protein
LLRRYSELAAGEDLFMRYNHVSVMNGIARSALDGLKALANTKTTAMTRTDLRDEPQKPFTNALVHIC